MRNRDIREGERKNKHVGWKFLISFYKKSQKKKKKERKKKRKPKFRYRDLLISTSELTFLASYNENVNQVCMRSNYSIYIYIYIFFGLRYVLLNLYFSSRYLHDCLMTTWQF